MLLYSRIVNHRIVTFKYFLSIHANPVKIFLEISTAQDAEGDRAPIFVAACPLCGIGAALEQHRSIGEEIIPTFLSMFN